MAEQPQVSEDVTPKQFFEELMPMGFATQVAEGAPTPENLTIQFKLTGEFGGDWHATIADKAMRVRPGSAEAHFTVTLSVDDWRDAVLARNGANLTLIIPQNRPGRPDNSERAKTLKGTMAMELSRPAGEPFRVEMMFNNTAAPKTTMRLTLADYLDIQTGKQNGQQLFMQGRIRVEGDMALLMQVAQLTM